MATIEGIARPEAARREHAQAVQRRLCWGAGWGSSFRGHSAQELQASVRPEDLVRSQLFYNSTSCWV